MAGHELVVTEKLDGENTTLYADGVHARSLDSGHHPSRAWVKALQGRIGPALPAGWRVCGENVYARHSLAYTELDSWFYGFSVWDEQDRCLDWDRTVRFLRRLGVPVPPVLWRGMFGPGTERTLRRLHLDTARQEGYVVRTVAGFGREEFARRVAKWVRPKHVRTGTHWMHAPVVVNGLGPRAPLWAVRSGEAPDPAALVRALGMTAEPSKAAVDEVAARLDVLGRTGDARLAGVAATALHGIPRARLAAGLVAPLGMPWARRVTDLVGLCGRLHRPFPDRRRPRGLARLAVAADLGVLHAVAAAVADGSEAGEQAEWSRLHAEEAGLLGEAPFQPLRDGLRQALAGLEPAAADRCWAEARGRFGSVPEAVAGTWRWRDGGFPRLVQLVGLSGSGKSTFAERLPDVTARISLDDLRQARGSRADQRANAQVLRDGCGCWTRRWRQAAPWSGMPPASIRGSGPPSTRRPGVMTRC
jgi:hypothetical protein